jgi:hypothetical protein
MTRVHKKKLLPVFEMLPHPFRRQLCTASQNGFENPSMLGIARIQAFRILLMHSLDHAEYPIPGLENHAQDLLIPETPAKKDMKLFIQMNAARHVVRLHTPLLSRKVGFNSLNLSTGQTAGNSLHHERLQRKPQLEVIGDLGQAEIFNHHSLSRTDRHETLSFQSAEGGPDRGLAYLEGVRHLPFREKGARFELSAKDPMF